MRIQVTVPVTLTVDYDTDGLSDSALAEKLSKHTAAVLKGHALSLADANDGLLIEDMTERTGWCIFGAYVSVE